MAGKKLTCLDCAQVNRVPEERLMEAKCGTCGAKLISTEGGRGGLCDAAKGGEERRAAACCRLLGAVVRAVQDDGARVFQSRRCAGGQSAACEAEHGRRAEGGAGLWDTRHSDDDPL